MYGEKEDPTQIGFKKKKEIKRYRKEKKRKNGRPQDFAVDKAMGEKKKKLVTASEWNNPIEVKTTNWTTI